MAINVFYSSGMASAPGSSAVNLRQIGDVYNQYKGARSRPEEPDYVLEMQSDRP